MTDAVGIVPFDQVGAGVGQALSMLWETLWALVLGFALSGVVQAFVSRGRMERVLGRHDPRTLARATFLGMVSSSCSYAATAMARSLVRKGADFTTSLVFMLASTNLVIELGIVLALLIGWQMTLAELAGGLVMITLVALLARVALPARVVAPVLAAAGHDGGGHDHGDMIAVQSRPSTLAGWSDAATYAIADLTLLRRELVIGFGVAGFLAALVPDGAWQVLFVSGHGPLTLVENAVVGPLIALLSFVCSIGNVPLAAALWKGGIATGGVIAFLFADLITLPLLLVYRRYWGWRLTLRITATFWVAMSVAGLVVGALFDAVGLVPSTRTVSLSPGSGVGIATSVLDGLAIALLLGMVVLSRLRGRLGGGTGYAIDPTCGMQVQVATAPARATVDGVTAYFCSEGCRDRWAGRAREAVR